MADLISETARKTAKLESEHNLQVLRKEGLLGLKRPLTIVASPHPAGSEVPSGKKVVHLIRHGQGFHNLLSDLWKDFGRTVDPTAKGEGAADVNPYDRPEVLDPPLTSIGRRQAQALQPQTERLQGLELIVVSPVRRATETALLAFAPRLAAPQCGGQRAVPLLGNEDCAERKHANICDKRRPMSEVKSEFPMVNWSLVTEEEDPIYSSTVPEAWRSVSDRGYKLLLWLRDRPEKEVAIATHSAWLFALMNTVLACTDPALAEWFQTGELRSVALEFVNGEEGEEVLERAAKVPRTASDAQGTA
mmetsp:Transcript_114840/g.335893  ORF Transcript_114840/g.335893 Transcript_114840/m.335893 type:complete len:304 (+) Transcript_114840:53-964(+)